MFCSSIAGVEWRIEKTHMETMNTVARYNMTNVVECAKACQLTPGCLAFQWRSNGYPNCVCGDSAVNSNSASDNDFLLYRAHAGDLTNDLL